MRHPGNQGGIWVEVSERDLNLDGRNDNLLRNMFLDVTAVGTHDLGGLML